VHGSHFRKGDVPNLPAASVNVPWLSGDRKPDLRTVPEESPITLVYDGNGRGGHGDPRRPRGFRCRLQPHGRRDLRPRRDRHAGDRTEQARDRVADVAHGSKRPAIQKRQRRLVGPTGCGLCGIESLAEATRSFEPLARKISLRSSQIERAIGALSRAQALNHATHATHAAGFYLPDDTLVVIREDVGRHNAVDKLAGALAARDIPGQCGAILVTSRVSIELVQKAAAIGIAISAPTALAVRAAEACGMTLVAIARGASSCAIISVSSGLPLHRHFPAAASC
jgi:FdhD protein